MIVSRLPSALAWPPIYVWDADTPVSFLHAVAPAADVGSSIQERADAQVHPAPRSEGCIACDHRMDRPPLPHRASREVGVLLRATDRREEADGPEMLLLIQEGADSA